MIFNSIILTIPGLTNSGEHHWQSIWEKKYGFLRINQKDWDTPICNEWIDEIENYSRGFDLSNTLFVGHSLGCTAIAFWVKKYNRRIKGALFVAPSDTEREDFPKTATGFKPIPLFKLPFRTNMVISSNDNFVSAERAKEFAKKWGSNLINIGNAGHINTASGHGAWTEGLQILKELD